MGVFRIELSIASPNTGLFRIDGKNLGYLDWNFVNGAPQDPTEVRVDGQTAQAIAGNMYVVFQNLYSNLGLVCTVGFESLIIEGEFNEEPTNPFANPGIDFEVSASVGDFAIQSLTYFEESQTPCSTIRVQMITNGPADRLLEPYIDDTLDTAVNILELQRGVPNIPIVVLSGTVPPQTATGTFTGVPPAINSNSVEVEVDSNSTAVVTYYSEGTLNVQFSLDDGDYQDSNIFFGLNPGSHNIKIKDEFGCIVSKSFTVQEVIPDDTFVYLSKANSIRFKEINNLLPNDDNLLSCESLDWVAHRELQTFSKDDIVKVQIKSFVEPQMVINGNNIAPEKVTENVGRTECMDSKRIEQDGFTFLYFTDGYYLNCSDESNKSAYSLRGTVPVWAEIGQVIQVNGENRVILSVDYLESVNARAIRVDTVNSAAKYVIRVTYNLFDYEVWEFPVNMNDYVSLMYFNIQMSVVNSNGTYSWLSEPIYVGDISKFYRLDYSMSRNTDIYYFSGISFFLNVMVEQQKAVSEATVESYKTDDDITQTDQDVYELDEFTFEPVTKELARKIVLALSHDKVKINDEDYIAREISLEVQGKSNLYTVIATMYKGGSRISVDRFFDYESQMPKLVENKPDNFIAQ